MLLNASGDGKYIGIKNDVLGWKIQCLGEQFIASRADLDFPFEGVCLAGFVKGHHDDCSSILQAQ